MKIALYGATGTIGQRIKREALGRGHHVTAIVRDPSKIVTENRKLNRVKGDALDAASVAELVRGHDVVINATSAPHDNPYAAIDVARSQIKGLTEAGVKRLIVVGGAGSLEVAPGVQLVDTPEFPKAWFEIADAHRDALGVYKSEAGELDWTYLSPAALIEPGERTGNFRLGGTNFLSDAEGISRISAEDYAVALLDEIENPQHVKQQFTLAY